VLALALAAWLSRQWARPLAAVEEATARIARGELQVRVPLERADEIGDVVRNVNLMAESLQRMEGARRRWVADISHELRTPLTGLRGEIEALVDGVRPFTHTAVLSLREEVLRLGALVDDLHLLSMADLQRLPCEPVACDAIALLHDVVRRFHARAEKRGLTLALTDGLPATLTVQWDAARMAQLLGNLMENSLRYTDAPGRIELGLSLRNELVALTVEDSSPGVVDADLPRLFEPLFRADTARGRHNGGSGLGLAICEAIAQAHGGRITAQSSSLGGLQVTVTLPAPKQERFG
jgi:two-component system, OmpR family, sensor histidine kinase BaeS